jgi:hypothetical protein
MEEDLAKFYVGSVVLALEYLHDNNLVYRWGVPVVGDGALEEHSGQQLVMLCPLHCSLLCLAPRKQTHHQHPPTILTSCARSHGMCPGLDLTHKGTDASTPSSPLPSAGT